VVVFDREPLAQKLQEFGGRTVEVQDDVWWDAYLQPAYQYLRRVLELAGCNEWAKGVPEGEPDEEPTLVTAKLEIHVPEAETATLAIVEIKRVIKLLREKGCTVSFSIEESSRNLSSIEGAPAGYKYRPLKRPLPDYEPLSSKWLRGQAP
jgi:hypothetical protein